MKEFLLLIRTEGDYCAEMPAEQYQQHLQKVSNYICRTDTTGKIQKRSTPSHGRNDATGEQSCF